MATQLDRIEQRLAAMEKTLSKLAEAQSTSALSDAMEKAVAQTLAIKKAQDEQAAAKTEPALGEPKVDKPTSEPGEVQPYKEQPETAKHRPDQFGGAPAVQVGKADPDTPEKAVGLPMWEKGREPREVKIGKRRKS